ncbi:MAG TPA: CpsD/CapB family tyrosine-protein kinase [Ktedonobacteraceae bacterium]|nr:CpsD/CapB family tyrosine-protein kinase [Ktedonobacteraceae bacterium]
MSIRSHEQVALLTDYDANSAYSEAFRTLYANIRFNWNSEKDRLLTLLITTPASFAGHTAAAANTAIVAAQSGTSVILVDADLREPGLEQRFGVGQHQGLSDLLEEEEITPQKVASCLQQTFIPGLRLLGAGSKSGPAELLHLTRLEAVFSGIRSLLAEETAPAIVIFHSAPVLLGADASILAALVEQTLLVLAKNRTTRAQAKQAQEQLERVHAHLAGVILLDI